eukprot:Gb_12034 [translate_table: standard]
MDPSGLGGTLGSTLFPYFVLGIVLLGTLVLNRFWFGRNKARLPPGPAAWPIVGNLFQLGKKPNESLFHLSQKYGPLMTLFLGTRTTVVVSSPAMAREFLRTNDHIFASRTPVQAANCLSYLKSSLIWADYGSHWRMLRRICNNELFSSKRLDDLQHLRRGHVFEMVRLIYEDHLKGKSINVGHTVFISSVNLLGNMIFSQNVLNPHSAASDEFKETVWKMIELSGTPNLADFFPFLQFLVSDVITRPIWRECMRYLTNSFKIASHPDIKTAALQRLRTFWISCWTSKAMRMPNGATQTSRHSYCKHGLIHTMVWQEMFTAGSETTSATIEWAMAELIRKPQTMKRAQMELNDVVGRHRRVEESDTEKLPYLQAVVKEVLRLHPPAPFLIPHTAERCCEIGGYLIPKNSQVMVNVWAIGRDPAIWKEPLHFFPERFLECDHMDYKGHNFKLIPFGAGRRICVGLPLAYRMLHFVLASLLHSFDWRLPHGQNSDEMDMTEKFGITLQKAVPLIAIPTPRLPSNIY